MAALGKWHDLRKVRKDLLGTVLFAQFLETGMLVVILTNEEEEHFRKIFQDVSGIGALIDEFARVYRHSFGEEALGALGWDRGDGIADEMFIEMIWDPTRKRQPLRRK